MSNTSRKTKHKQAERAEKTKGKKKWSQKVATVSTFPPEGTFTKGAETVARIMAQKKVSPQGLGSAIRMVQFYINRAGKDLPKSRKRELEKAKHILQEKLREKKRRSAS